MSDAILALDMATHCGWAALCNGQVYSGVWDLTPRRHEPRAIRFIRFRARLSAAAERFRPRVIAYERCVYAASWDGAHTLHGLLCTFEVWLADSELAGHAVPSVLPLAPASIKVHATGRGNADKAQMMAAARARGWQYKDDNEADALWVLDLARHRQNKGER